MHCSNNNKTFIIIYHLMCLQKPINRSKAIKMFDLTKKKLNAQVRPQK